jgi:class 3 adenylate cyclase/pimeloyl-ACP methyl ester carboxylesterase
MVPRTRWARTVDGASIAYQDVGEGPLVLVVIHGWISHLEVYWEQPLFARFMRRLSRHLRVIHFDKRGTGLSDRLVQLPDLETRMDDVRAVMDAAAVDRAAILGWGTGGPPLALFFAATNPDRTVAVCVDPNLLEKNDAEYIWGADEAEQEDWVDGLVATWGDPERMRVVGFGDEPGDAPRHDPAFVAWFHKFARYSATPTSYEAFDRMWYETDVRDILDAVHVPTAVLYRKDRVGWGERANAMYLSDRLPAAELVEVEGAAPVLWIEEPEPLVSAVERFLDSVQRQEQEFDRVLTTVLFTDIVGSTERAAELGDRAWKDIVQRHHATIRALLARYRGTEIDTAGDGFYASFDGPARAVRCAHAITDSIARLGLHVRVGVHTGEVELIDGKPGGMTVNIGARIAAKAAADEVLVSQTIKDLVVGSGLTFHDRGLHQLRGAPGSWQLYAADS